MKRPARKAHGPGRRVLKKPAKAPAPVATVVLHESGHEGAVWNEEKVKETLREIVRSYDPQNPVELSVRTIDRTERPRAPGDVDLRFRCVTCTRCPWRGTARYMATSRNICIRGQPWDRPYMSLNVFAFVDTLGITFTRT